MAYLEDFEQRIERDDYQGFLQLWEELCSSEGTDSKDLAEILETFYHSRFAGRFGPIAETALPMWEVVEDKEDKHRILRAIVDLETTNSPSLAEIVYHNLTEAYGAQENFDEKIRLIGLRNRESFQGAIRNFELLTHLEKGNFVYHTGGWGTGEVIDVSLVREELVLEFEAVPGKKSLAFENAFANLVAIEQDHFLARRFGDPDSLEEFARKDPVAVIRMLLADLGPKSAAEIKEEMAELIIPLEDWPKWWQSARGRVKKDTQIETPKSIREPFRLRTEALAHADRVTDALKEVKEPADLLQTTYNFVRDFPEILRNEESRDYMKARLLEVLSLSGLSDSHRLQITALLEEFFGEKLEQPLAKLIESIDGLPVVIDEMEINAFKKVSLVAIRKGHPQWGEIFLEMLFTLPQSALREYLIKELATPDLRPKLLKRLEELLEVPIRHAHFFVWAFQRVMGRGSEVPLNNPSDIYRYFEAFLTLLHQLEHVPEHRELAKKMYGLLVAKRYALVRDTLKNSMVEFAREFLLLVSKCHSLSGHDQKIMQSLVEVAHPNLAKEKGPVLPADDLVIWTTQEGYQKIHDRIEHIGTVETVENAREVEEARAHGDLRENAEYKAACERRSRLQGEIKMLSDQLNRARVLTPQDIPASEVGTGSVVTLRDDAGKEVRYTLLGPWDADPDAHILSYQSKLAQAMTGLQAGDTFSYQDKSFTIDQVESFFDAEMAR